jgi:cell division protein FtsL
MSTPAHSLAIPAEHRTIAPAPAPERVRDPRTPAARPTTPPEPSPRRARRGNPSAFWVLTALLVTAMVVGVVSISAVLVRASFRMDALRSRIATAVQTQQDLRQDLAALSSPSRVHAWARDAGFIVPDGVVILSVADPGGDG